MDQILFERRVILYVLVERESVCVWSVFLLVLWLVLFCFAETSLTKEL